MNRMSVWTEQKYQVSSCYPNSNKHQWYSTLHSHSHHTMGLTHGGWDIQFCANMDVQSQLGRHQQPKRTVAKEPLKAKGRAFLPPPQAITEYTGATSGRGNESCHCIKRQAHQFCKPSRLCSPFPKMLSYWFILSRLLVAIYVIVKVWIKPHTHTQTHTKRKATNKDRRC